MATPRIDLLDHELYTSRRHHEVFRQLRVEQPVSWHEHPTARGFWNFVRYDDIVEISRNPNLFSAEQGSVLIVGPDEGGLAGHPDPRGIQMINVDPPRHATFRRIFGSQFTPRSLRAFQAFIELNARHIVDRVIESGVCDFARDIATQLPLAVTSELLGVPEEDRQDLQLWSTQLLDENEQGAHRYLEYVRALAETYRNEVNANLVSKMLHSSVDGRALSTLEFQSNMILLAIAGNETTRSVIAQGMLELLAHDGQCAALRSTPALMDSAVEEILRWVTPTMQMRRTVTENTIVGGQSLRAGDKVVMWYVSGSRDETVFDDSFAFDISRNPNPHMAFGGGGTHFCLGASLARIEIRAILGEVLGRMNDIELAGVPEFRVSPNFILGVDSMPLRFAPGPRTGDHVIS